MFFIYFVFFLRIAFLLKFVVSINIFNVMLCNVIFGLFYLFFMIRILCNLKIKKKFII